MSALDRLIASAGEWRGTNVLQDPGTIQPSRSDATATIAPLLDGRFVRIDYTWRYQDTAQSGSLLIGFNPKTSRASAHWIDSWHNGVNVMACDGTIEESGAVDVRGSYAAPPGPDWGWRTVVTPSPGTVRIVMHNIWPEGKEDLAVEAEFTRI